VEEVVWKLWNKNPSRRAKCLRQPHAPRPLCANRKAHIDSRISSSKEHWGLVVLGGCISVCLVKNLRFSFLLIISPAAVRSKHNLRFYAMKVLNKDKIVKTKQVEHTNNEQQMLESVQHPFIINLWGTFQDSANLYMVMDFVPGGELFTLLRRSNVSVF
jgi:serine/threonine protein kinase